MSEFEAHLLNIESSRAAMVVVRQSQHKKHKTKGAGWQSEFDNICLLWWVPVQEECHQHGHWSVGRPYSSPWIPKALPTWVRDFLCALV